MTAAVTFAVILTLAAAAGVWLNHREHHCTDLCIDERHDTRETL